MLRLRLFCAPILLFAAVVAAPAQASRSFVVALPDVQIVADKIVRGDGDTYGLGDWRCLFKITLEGAVLKIEGEISFTEKANDFTTIVGEYRGRVVVDALEKCGHCVVSLDETFGTVGGPNIGARGHRWYGGQGLVRRAKIVTDTFGDDAGRIGGTVQFAPLRVLIDCPIAGNL